MFSLHYLWRIINAFRRRRLTHRHTFQTQGSRLKFMLAFHYMWEQIQWVWANPARDCYLLLLCHARRQGKEGERREEGEEARGRGMEKEKEKEGRKGFPVSPPESQHGDTHWLNRIRERTMNLKMYSKAFMALYSWSLIPGLSALST